MDEYVETVLIPQYTKGTRRRSFPAYQKVQRRLAHARNRGDRDKTRQLRHELRRLPASVPNDPDYGRLRYSRYADDHLLGFIGPKAEAEKIKAQLAEFLRDELKLELSAEKTLITHARSQPARYLGYEIIVQHEDSKITRGRRMANGTIALRVPHDVIKAKSGPYLRHGKPWHRSAMQNLDDFDIVKTYGAEYRGLVQYYTLANDVWRLNRLCWAARTSMLKTLAAKHQSTVAKMAAKHKAKIETPHGLRTCYEARVERTGKQPLVARFGGIPLCATRTPSLLIASRHGFPILERSWSSGSSREGASCAKSRPRWWSTKSGPSPVSESPMQASPRGRHSWPRCGGRPWSSAKPAMTLSTTGNQPPKRRRSLESYVHRKMPAWFGGGLRGKGPRSATSPRSLSGGARALWRHSARSSRSVTTCQGGREGRPQGEGAQVTGHQRTRRYAKCKAPKWFWVSSVKTV